MSLSRTDRCVITLILFLFLSLIIVQIYHRVSSIKPVDPFPDYVKIEVKVASIEEMFELASQIVQKFGFTVFIETGAIRKQEGQFIVPFRVPMVLRDHLLARYKHYLA